MMKRTNQIQPLYKNFMLHLENKSKTRFDTVQTMVEAKFALRGLFEQAAQYHRNYVQAQKALTDVQESNKEVRGNTISVKDCVNLYLYG